MKKLLKFGSKSCKVNAGAHCEDQKSDVGENFQSLKNRINDVVSGKIFQVGKWYQKAGVRENFPLKSFKYKKSRV